MLLAVAMAGPVSFAWGAPQSAPDNQVTRTCADTDGKPLPCPPERTAVVSKHNPSNETVTLRSVPRNIVGDQKDFWSFPARLRVKDLKWALPFAGATAYLLENDHYIETKLPSSASTIKRANSISNYGAFAFGGAVGGAFLLGSIVHNDHMRETSILSGEAVANSYIATLALKSATGRQRPTEGDGRGEFWDAGKSFPSEHSAAAWSIAAVLSREYPSLWVKALGYGGATAITATRVIGRKHFASDVLIGSALGYYIGRETYNRHAGGSDAASYGTFVRGHERESRNPEDMGSPFVPIDSWVYPIFDRLAASGYIPSAFLGVKPWTRMECARLVEEATDVAGSAENRGSESQQSIALLADEFRPELERQNGAANLDVQLDSIYTRVMNINGKALTDGFHFGQTIVNDWGRPDRSGTNVVTGMSAHANAGPLTFYVRGEFQHSPEDPAPSLSAATVAANSDFLPPPTTVLPSPSVNRFRTIEAYVGLSLSGWQISFGNQSLWWGPDQTGPMLFSNNAEPIPMLRFTRVSPFKLPSFLGWLGPIRSEYFVGQLRGHDFIGGPNFVVSGQYGKPIDPQPYIQGAKVAFKPTPNFEFSVSTTSLFAGQGVPFNTHTFLIGATGTGNGQPGTRNDPGDRRSAFDFSYRLPKLRDRLMFYANGFADDQYSPIAYPDRSAWTAGLYAPKLPLIPKLDFRVEGTFTDLPIGGGVSRGFFYLNLRFRNGYTSNSHLLGNWIGRQGQGAQAWSTYHFGPRNSVTLGFRHQKVSPQFIADGGTVTDGSVRSDFWLRKDLSVGGLLQYERWKFPVLELNQQNNWTSSIQFTFWPKHFLRPKP